MSKLYCKCLTWCRDSTETLYSNHHENCPHRDIEDEAKEHLQNIIAALEYEACLGDGISDKYFKVYQKAKFFTTGKLVEDKS